MKKIGLLVLLILISATTFAQLPEYDYAVSYEIKDAATYSIEESGEIIVTTFAAGLARTIALERLGFRYGSDQRRGGKVLKIFITSVNQMN